MSGRSFAAAASPATPGRQLPERLPRASHADLPTGVRRARRVDLTAANDRHLSRACLSTGLKRSVTDPSAIAACWTANSARASEDTIMP
ncbi:hypothetical protein PG987_007786 [Apiospora arundinis]